jgi:hypothetical protein
VELNKIDQWMKEHAAYIPKAMMHKWIAIVRANNNPTVANLLAVIDDDRMKAERRVMAAANALIKRVCPQK